MLATVRDAFALLVRLREERIPAEEAYALFQQLAARHPGVRMDIVWEQETFEDVLHYDILLGVGKGTCSLSYCAEEELPWAVRGIQRINESHVVRVNERPVSIADAVTSLDYAWHTLHIGRHLVNLSLIDEELRRHGLTATDEELAEALVGFRQRRRLYTLEELERWMAEHGTTQVQLETHLEREVAVRNLRTRVVGDHVQAYFERHRSDFDTLQGARLYVPGEPLAWRLHEQLRADPGRFWALAQERFLAGGPTAETFVTLRRRELEPTQAERLFATAPGQVSEPVPSGDGWVLVLVLGLVPARFEDVQSQVAEILFADWLAEKRRSARVEWFWGQNEAVPVPAVAL
jgi:putative peptide maturation system protein